MNPFISDPEAEKAEGLVIALPWPDRRGRCWSAEEDAALAGAWEAGLTRTEIASISGKTVGAIANRAARLRLSQPREWTGAEVARVTSAYQSASCSEEIGIRALAQELGRSYASVIAKASRLGLGDPKRKGVIRRKDAPKYGTPEEYHAAMRRNARDRIAKNGHPRGMAGKRHSAQTKQIIAAKSREWNAGLTPAERSAQSLKALKTKAERYGSAAGTGGRGSWKAGWREIGGKRNYYRSRWEANYARYLEFLKNAGLISDWQHEPETFWFEAIKRGVRSYLPDFRVWENDGSTVLHEVKGWMDARSKTTLKRMAKYHPQERIVVVRERDYNDIARKLARLIEGWEHSERAGRW